MSDVSRTAKDVIRVSGLYWLQGEPGQVYLERGTPVRWGVEPRTNRSVMRVLDGPLCGEIVYGLSHRPVDGSADGKDQAR